MKPLTAWTTMIYSLTLRTVNTTTPNPSLVRKGGILAVPVVRTPLLTKEGLGVVVRKVIYSLTAWLILLSYPVSAIPTIQQWETSNGARVYFVAAPELPMVDIEVTFDAGSARDGSKFGLASMTKSLLKEGGSGEWDADQVAEQFENWGAQFSVSLDRDMAAVNLRSLTDTQLLSPALNLLTVVLKQPTFREKSLEQVRQRMLNALKMQEQDPASVADNVFYQAVYGDHPYAISEVGLKETVMALKREEVVAFHQRYYVAKNAIVAIVGALDKTGAEQLANQVVGTLPAGETAPALPAVADLKEANLVHRPHPATQTHILIGQPGVARNDPDYFSLYVGNYILGGSGFASLLMDEVREKRGLAYSIYSYFSPQRVPGPFIAGLETRNDQTEEALKIVRQVLQDFVAQGPPAEKLKLAKQGITGGFPLRIKNNSNILGYLSVIGFYRLPLDYLQTFNQNIEAVTLEKIKDAFQRRLHLDKMVTVTVGGEPAAKEAN